VGLKHIAESIRGRFYRWGWLTPALFPLAEVAGRGAFNTLSAIYFLWALVSLRSLPRESDGSPPHRWFMLLYGLMLTIWTLSLTQAADPQKGVYDLLRYVQYSLTGLFTVIALRQAPRQLPRLMHAMAWGALLVVVVLYLELPYYLLAVDFNPTQQLREDNLPWLLPFLLLGVVARPHARWLAAAAIMACAVYVALSQGRAALLGLPVALGLFGVLGFRMRKWIVLLTGLAVLAMGIVVGQHFFRGLSSIAFNFATLDRFTSGRATLWWQALNAPPDNPWLGVGIGNVVAHTEVLRIGELTVKHLHNFVIDAWYETGLLGLFAMFALIGAVLAHAVRLWSQLDADHRRIAATALAGIGALLTAGLFSFSYTSRQFAVYLFLMFAILLALPARQRQ
jgi:teichuronic acid biosynthesis protein TuaE